MNLLTEREGINNFVSSNKGKKIVAVQGLGFVGAVMSVVIANSPKDEYAVIGVDLPNRKATIDAINNGKFPIQSSDSKVYKYFDLAIERNNFFATSSTYAYEVADVVVVDINLDVSKESGIDNSLIDYSVSLDGFKKAMETIASVCREDVLILVETTVPPGTCQKIVKPIFDKMFRERGFNHNVKIGHSYERVMPGPNYLDSIKNFYRVYSGINEESANATEEFLKTIISTDEYPLTRLNNTNATEMSKVLENSFRAMNIAFIQEWTEFAESANVNLYEVIDAIRMRPTHKNIMRPGIGVGGYCLTKDPLLASWSSKELFNSENLKLSERAVQINDQMPLHTFNTIKNYFKGDLKDKNIFILGISYLKDVGDTRYTPLALLYDKLIQMQANLTLNDPYIDIWEEKGVKINNDLKELKRDLDIIVIGTPHSIYFDEKVVDNLINNNSKKVLVVDSHGVISNDYIKKHNKHKFIIIGRGDV